MSEAGSDPTAGPNSRIPEARQLYQRTTSELRRPYIRGIQERQGKSESRLCYRW
jgi:hypothetical protein